jgi:transcriptional regulator with XRE-family HTH domain
MLGGLYESIASTPDGLRSLASARLRRRVLILLHRALNRSGLSQRDLAKKLGYRRSAVNQVFRGDGNVRIETLAEYLHELGYELDLNLVPAGEHRRALEENRVARPPSTETLGAGPIAWRAPAGLHVGAASQTSSPSVSLRLGAVS